MIFAPTHWFNWMDATAVAMVIVFGLFGGAVAWFMSKPRKNWQVDLALVVAIIAMVVTLYLFADAGGFLVKPR